MSEPGPLARIRTAARALIVQEAQVLVVEYRDAEGPWYLLPGGGQQHEETLDACLQRELAEELDVRIEIGGLLHVREFISSRYPGSHMGPGFHQVEMIFAAQLLPGETPRLPPTADRLQTGFAWLPVAQLERHRLHPVALRDLIGREAEVCYLGAV